MGESSGGLGLLRRAAQFSSRNGIPDLPEEMTKFIRQEQRHLAVLGFFLDQELIPRLREHWVDGLFRWVRRLAGYEWMLTVLVCAEFVAVPTTGGARRAVAEPALR